MQQPRLPATEPFTTATALGLGYDRKTLSRLVKQKVLRRPFTGVYVRSCLPDITELRVRAIRLVMASDMVLCDRTAAWVWGVDTFAYGELDGPMSLECYSPRFRRSSDRERVSGGSRDLAAEDWCTVDEVRVTTPLRTALDLGCNLTRRDALAAMDALARGHGFTAAELACALPRFRRRRGVLQARQLVPLVDPRAESPPESWMREVIDDNGLAMPEPQHWVLVAGIPTYRLDLAYVKARIAVEYDGEAFHSSLADTQRDEARRDWLRSHGWYVIVLTKESFTAEAIELWIGELRDELRVRTASHKRF